MPDGGSAVRITEEMLQRIAAAAQRNPQTTARVVGQVADQLGTSVDDVVRSVRDAAGVVGGAALAFAQGAWAAIDSAISAGALSAPAVASTAAGAAGASTAAAGSSATSSSGGAFAWFTGMNVVTQVAAIIGAVVLTTAVVDGIGALGGSEPAVGYKAVGVQFDESVRIVSVRHTDAIDEGIAPCNFRHGGIDCESEAVLIDLDPGVYETAAEASEALCRLLDGPRFAPAFSDGWSVPYEGGSVTLDDWGSVDFGVCDPILEGQA